MYSFAKAQDTTNKVDEVKEELCRALLEHKRLVTIFKFDGKKHNGNLEDAILEALLDGKDRASVVARRSIDRLCFTAAKNSEDDSKQFHRTAELKLALVSMITLIDIDGV